MISNEKKISLKSSSISTERIIDETQANVYMDAGQGISSICTLSNDTLAVAWESDGQDGWAEGVYARVFNATTGNNITREFRVNHNTTYGQRLSSICVLSRDSFVVVWQSNWQDGSGQGVYARVFNATTGNNITKEFRINYNTVDDQQRPSVCNLTKDSLAVAWQSLYQDGDEWGIYATVINATTRLNITREVRVNAYTTGWQDFPSICALSNDSFAVTWQSSGGQDGDAVGIFARIYNATTGENITKEFQVNTYMAGNQEYPSICRLTSDTFVIAWTGEGQGDTWGIYAKIFNSTTGLNITEEFQVNAYILNIQQGVSICAPSDDAFIMTWHSNGQDGDSNGIFANIFNSTTGNNITREFQVNQITAGDQVSPSICALSKNIFAISWTGADYNGAGVLFSVFSLDFEGEELTTTTSIPGFGIYIFIGFVGMITVILLKKSNKIVKRYL